MINKILCWMWGHRPFDFGNRITWMGSLISRPYDPYLLCKFCHADLEKAECEFNKAFLKDYSWPRKLNPCDNCNCGALKHD